MAVAACWERDPAAGEEWHELLPGGSLRAPYLTQRVWSEQVLYTDRFRCGAFLAKT